MKAAIVSAAGKPPVYGEFNAPTATAAMELVTVRASALSQFSKSRSSGTHYSAEGAFPAVAGADGVELPGTAAGCILFCLRRLTALSLRGAWFGRTSVLRSRTLWTT